MRTKISLFSALVAILILSACGNAEMEKRIANLERRVNQLENRGIARSAIRPTSNPTQTAKTIETDSSVNAKFQWENTVYNFGNINQGEVSELHFQI